MRTEYTNVKRKRKSITPRKSTTIYRKRDKEIAIILICPVQIFIQMKRMIST